MKLFMLLLGCRPPERNIEQHDILFVTGDSLKDTIPDILAFWPGGGTIHIDAWREITEVDGYKITILPKEDLKPDRKPAHRLFFLNLGGYKPGEFEEYHYKMVAVSSGKTEAISAAKQTAFYKHTGFKGAVSHIDDKYGIDVDDIYEIKDILPKETREKYAVQITRGDNAQKQDDWHLGYTILNKLVD